MIPTTYGLLTAAPILWLPLLPSTHASTAAGTTVIVTVTPTIPHPASYTSPEIFKDSILSASNAYRRDHNASQLTWNETLTSYAKHWAEGCKWKHSNGPYGENLAFGYPDPKAAIAAWGDEGQKYNFNSPGFSEETGHFTQLVWRATREVGCAASDCGYHESNAKDEEGRYTRAQGWYVVCEYWPAGNVVGDQNAFIKVNVQSASTYSGPETTGGSATGTSASASATASATPTSGGDELYDGRLRDQYQNAFVGLIVFINLV